VKLRDKKSVQFLSAGVIMIAMALGDNLHWLGHSAFRWTGSKTVYFDPYKLSGRPGKADLICVSHEHFDHCSKEDIARISTVDTVIVASADAARQLRTARVIAKEIRPMASGGMADINGIIVQAVPAYNVDKEFHPKRTGKLGFIVTMDGVSVYHAGDTDLIPEMRDVRCDIALLPVSGTYVMTADEAARAAVIIKPKLAIPMDYGEVVGSADDAQAFLRALQGSVEVTILTKEG